MNLKKFVLIMSIVFYNSINALYATQPMNKGKIERKAPIARSSSSTLVGVLPEEKSRS